MKWEDNVFLGAALLVWFIWLLWVNRDRDHAPTDETTRRQRFTHALIDLDEVRQDLPHPQAERVKGILKRLEEL